ncbi:MAG: bifunctional riboflavin kinase/FAD synthetase [Firmicutes bacterium]|nr:bifunctional riboflavin kinase/FAD synthetase [Bacillota bacterium]
MSGKIYGQLRCYVTMKVVYLNDQFELQGNSVLALGFFDGIHRGHRKILELARDLAKEKGCSSGILTFPRHPVETLRPEVGFHYITTFEERERIVATLGLDYFFLLQFDKVTANMPAEDFVNNILIKKLKIKAAVIGRDYRFGYQARGNKEMLKEMLEAVGGEVHVVEEIRENNTKVGSTAIREDLMNGYIEAANYSLGRWYSLEGVVQSGKQRGRELGVPTANLDLPVYKIIPPEGVYCFFALFNGKLFKALGSVGGRPTFGEYHPNIEIHLFDFHGNLYGKKLRVFFVHKMRDIVRFNSTDELVEQINKDKDAAREYMDAIPESEIERNLACCPYAHPEPSDFYVL